MLKNYKIKVNNEAESKEAQEMFKQLGYKLLVECHSVGMVAVNDGEIYPDVIGNWDGYEGEELTLPQLRDLVAQSKSKVREYLDPDNNYKLCLIKPSDAAHWMIEVPEGAECFIRMCTGLIPGAEFFFKDIDGDYMLWRDSNWIEASYDCAQEYIDEGDELLWSREQPQEQGLISGDEKTIKVNGLDFLIEGKDALRSALDGNDIQLSLEPWEVNSWSDFNPTEDEASTKAFFTGLSSDGQKVFFRLKPRTIKIELEIPSPFEPSLNEEYFYIHSCLDTGYAVAQFEDIEADYKLMQFGAWRTEEEIKQVVAALRGAICKK